MYKAMFVKSTAPQCLFSDAFIQDCQQRSMGLAPVQKCMSQIHDSTRMLDLCKNVKRHNDGCRPDSQDLINDRKRDLTVGTDIFCVSDMFSQWYDVGASYSKDAQCCPRTSSG